MNTKSEKWKKAMAEKRGKKQNQPIIFNYKCPYCGMEKAEYQKCHATFHEGICKANPNHREVKGFKHSDETKKLISEKRKKFLQENPEKHPWTKNSKFKSTPCEEFKKFLREKGYEFEEEVKVVPDRNFSVDICFPNLMLIFEINGNQHYNLRTMELLPYYQERHNIISSLGWQIVEIPYNQSYDENFRLGLCRQLDAKLTSNQYLCRFESCQPYLQTLKDIQSKKDEKNEVRMNLIKEGKVRSDGRIDPRMISESEWERRKNLILNCGVDLNKFGCVAKIGRITGLSKHQIEDTIDRFNLKVFKRK